jgi:phospholipid/cholesterol/gamma-HCH transport system ATP-binding protein
MTSAAPAATQPKIAITGLTKAFGKDAVLTGVDLHVDAGESLVLLGESGCGKTLLLKIVMGLVWPDSGSILLDGEETVGLRGDEREAVRGRFGMLFQQAALFDSLPVWRNISFQLLEKRHATIEEARAVAVQTLKAVGLPPETADLLPAELSGGMQKRVGFARAIAARPEILLLDEPTAGLDPITTQVICNLVLRNVHELGATAISITSDIAAAMRIADRIAMLHDGRIIWSGPAETLPDTGNPVVERFIHKWKVERAAA